jgi:hypothetical protein
MDAPELEIAEWVQGEASTLSNETGKVILIEVFQVNCPGCFIGGLPEAIEVYQKFKDQPLVVWGLATAFEDHDKNNLANLKKLLTTGEVIGDTLTGLTQSGLLDSNRLQYRIPFPIAWDKVVPNNSGCTEEAMDQIIRRDIPNFDSLPSNKQQMIRSQVESYLKQKQFNALTFEKYKFARNPFIYPDR